ncbi:MAG TPA: hypothetical protein VM577_02310 [Anaerovoracaceae bacterium]|nr:hypothetical protein [Anaerovoracaceae bacterium]
MIEFLLDSGAIPFAIPDLTDTEKFRTALIEYAEKKDWHDSLKSSLDQKARPIKSPMDLRDEQAALTNGATRTRSSKIKI